MIGRASILLAVVVFLVSVPAGCTSTETQTDVYPGLVSDGWVTHQDPLGFAVEHPPGWMVETKDGASVMILSADRSHIVLVQPIRHDGKTSATDAINLAAKEYPDIFPNAKISRSQRLDKGEQVVAVMNYKFQESDAQANVFCAMYGKWGTLYIMAAPKETFAGSRSEMVRVLRSFKFTVPTAKADPPAPKALEFVKWTDPVNKAFTVEVPKGWAVGGGCRRPSSGDIRHTAIAVPSDGSMLCFVGSWCIYHFTKPTPITAQTGWVEGQVITAYGYESIIMRYLTGAEFTHYFIYYVLGNSFSDIQMEMPRDRPDRTAERNAQYAQLGNPWRYSAGETRFTCSLDSVKLNGFCSAVTLDMNGSWMMTSVGGYVATPDKEDAAQEVYSRMTRTHRENPEWTRQIHREFTASQQQIVHNREVAEIFTETYARRSEAEDTSARHWSNAMLGVTDVRDPATGDVQSVQSGYPYYWTAPSGEVAPTFTADPPDLSTAWRVMEQF